MNYILYKFHVWYWSIRNISKAASKKWYYQFFFASRVKIIILFIILNYIALYYPNNSHFNKYFLLGVLNGRKTLMPIGCMGGFSFPYFNKYN